MAKTYAKWIDYDTNTLDRDGTKLKVKTDSTLLITHSLAENALTASYVDWSTVDNVLTSFLLQVLSLTTTLHLQMVQVQLQMPLRF